MAFEAQRASDGSSVAAEVALPEAVTDHGRRRRAPAHIVGRRQQAAAKRLDPEGVEEIAVHPQPACVPRFAAIGAVERRAAPRGESGKRLLAFANLLHQRIGHHRKPPAESARPSAVVLADPDVDKPCGIFDRKHAHPHRIEQLEDRGVRADAERQRQDGDDGEGRVEAKQSRAVPEIAPGAVEKADGIHLIDFLADQGSVAKFAPGRVPRLGGQHPARDVLVGFNREMRLELASAFVVPAGAKEKPPQAHAGFRMRLIAATI